VTTLPDTVTQADFDTALGELRAALGPEWVFAGEDRLQGYHDYYAIRDPDMHAPSAAVAPRNIDQIQQVLAVARHYRIPLWTVSTGRNLAYGTAAPQKPGCIVMDLKRMNRIIEVNEKHAYAVVEPGVSYFDLYNHLRNINSRLWIDCAAPGWGGVMGNLLDRGVGYTPYGEHFATECGMQFVQADGTVVETGIGGRIGDPLSHLYHYGRGPWVDGLFTQSNFAVVTRLAVQLMPAPPGYRPFMITMPREEDIELFTDLLLPLKLALVVPNAAVTVELNLEAAIKVSRAQYYTGKGPVPDSARRRMMADLDIGMWNFYGALYGTEAMMDNNWRLIEDTFRRIPGVKFYLEQDKGKEPSFAYRAKLMQGIPNLTEFSFLNWIPNGAHVGFSPMAPVSGKTALDQYRFVVDVAHKHGFDYLGEYVVGWRDMHHIYVPVYDRADLAMRQRLYEMMKFLIKDAARQGMGEYRTHLDFMDSIAATYNWNDGALANVNQRIKDAVDPQGILAPGKSGIWPARGKDS